MRLSGWIVYMLMISGVLWAQIFCGGDGSGFSFNEVQYCLSWPYSSTGKESGFSFNEVQYCLSWPYSSTGKESGFAFSHKRYCLPWSFGGSISSGFNYNAVQYCSPVTFVGTGGGSGFSSSKGECLSPQPVPVTWLEIMAFARQNSIIVSWRVTGEFNCASYVVNKLLDGEFKPIGVLICNNIFNEEQMYSFVDNNPLFGPNYYFVRQVDVDGAFDESEIVVAYYDGSANNIEPVVFPNPVRQNGFIQVMGVDEGWYRYELLDLRGGLLIEGDVETTGGSLRLDLPWLAEGIYYLHLQNKYKQYRAKILVVSS